MVHIQQDGVDGTCEAQPTKGLGITAAHVHQSQRKQNGEWKGGEQESKNSKLRVRKRGGRGGNQETCYSKV